MWWTATNLHRQLKWMQQELTALREERTLLLRDLNIARDRGDQAVNQLLEAKGERPIMASPSPPLPERDPFEEDPDRVTEIRDLISTHGAEAAFNGER